MTDRADGLLVSIDGPGGVGKSATIEHLAGLLDRAGLSVYRTAQPSGGPIGALAAAEIAHYREAAAHLEQLGVSVLSIDTTHTPADRVAVRIAAAIPDLRRAALATAGQAA